MFRAASSPPHLTTLILLTAISVLSLNMFLPSLAGISQDLNADYGLVSLSVSGYLAITAVLQIILGPLSDRFGRRPVLLATVAIFAVASVVCAMAENIWVFLGARIFQGAIVSGSAIASAVIRDTSEESQAASLLSYVSMAMAVAPMLGPMLGGVLEAWFGWRASFWVYSGMGLALLWLVWADLEETNKTPSATFAAQMKAYPDLLRSRRFWAYSIVMSFGVGAFYVFISSAPFVAAQIFDMSPAVLGFGIGTITLGFFAGSFLSGRIATRKGILWMIMAGRIVAFVGIVIGLLLYVTGLFQPWVFFAAAVLTGFGNGLTTPSARAAALSVRPNLAGSAAGLSGALIMAVGAVLTVVPGLLLTAQNGVWVTMVLLGFLALGGLISALYVRALDRREGRVSQAPHTQTDPN